MNAQPNRPFHRQMSSSGGKGSKGGAGGNGRIPKRQRQGSTSSAPAAPASKSQKSGKGGKGKGNRNDNMRLLDVVFHYARNNGVCLKFVQGQACVNCRFDHYCFWAEGSNVHWITKDVGDLPTAEQIDSIRYDHNDKTEYTLDETEFDPAQTPAQVTSTPAAIVIADDQAEEKKSAEEPSFLKPCLRQNEWEKEKGGLDAQIRTLEHNLGAPGNSESDTQKIEERLERVRAKLQEGQRRCDARDDYADVRCGRADEGLPESTANEFRYILVPAKSWGEYNPADDGSVPGAADQGTILDQHTKEQVQSMTWLFYQLVQGLAQPEGNSRKKGQFIPPPSCSSCATSMDYVTTKKAAAFNSGVPRGEDYPNPCFRCMCVWYCSAKCKYGHRHHHSLACHRHPAYLTAAELLEQYTAASLATDVTPDSAEAFTPGEDPEDTATAGGDPPEVQEVSDDEEDSVL